jgi:hypothetical protein
VLHVLLAKSVGMSGQPPSDEAPLSLALAFPPLVPESSPGPFVAAVDEPPPSPLELDPSACRLPTLTLPPQPVDANTIAVTAIAAD